MSQNGFHHSSSYTSLTASSMKSTNSSINCEFSTNQKTRVSTINISNITEADLPKLQFITNGITDGSVRIVNFTVFTKANPSTPVTDYTGLANQLFQTENTNAYMNNSRFFTSPFGRMPKIVDYTTTQYPILGKTYDYLKLFQIVIEHTSNSV
jgi:hypothetical protein